MAAFKAGQTILMHLNQNNMLPDAVHLANVNYLALMSRVIIKSDVMRSIGHVGCGSPLDPH